MIQISIIIRTKNEQAHIREVFEMLKKQTVCDFEIIVVDSGSIDKTMDIVEEYNNVSNELKGKISSIKIKQEEFTYPYASNIGAKKAQGKYLCYLSGHSVPISNEWLSDGLKCFINDKIAGVYCPPVYPLDDASRIERFSCFLGRIIYKKRKIIKKKVMGLMGTTNAIIRKDLWEKYNFNLEFANGGEDSDWADYWLGKGYFFVCDMKFSVRHTHGKGLVEYIKQYLHWKSCFKPHKFSYRKHKFN